MATLPLDHPHAVEATRERELTLVREAIAMVAEGAARRVVVGGLRFGDTLIDPATEMAASLDVRIVSLPQAGGQRSDIAVERAGVQARDG
jgi:hypothetical protein